MFEWENEIEPVDTNVYDRLICLWQIRNTVYDSDQISAITQNFSGLSLVIRGRGPIESLCFEYGLWEISMRCAMTTEFGTTLP